MELAEYQRMHEAELRHFWFRGSRAVIGSWLDRVAVQLGTSGRLRLVDVGAGTGGMLASLDERFDGVGVEFNGAGARFCADRGVAVVQGGLPSLPFAPGIFDCALSMDVFEHIEDDLAAMREVRRVMRRGGRLVTTVPALPWLWSRHDEALHHHRRYMRGEFVDRLEACGFQVERCSYYNTLLLPPMVAVRLMGKVVDKVKPNDAVPTSDVGEVPTVINELFAHAFGSERHWLRVSRLPIGASLIADCTAV